MPVRINPGLVTLPTETLRLLYLHRALNGEAQNSAISRIVGDWLANGSEAKELERYNEIEDMLDRGAIAKGMGDIEYERRLLAEHDTSSLKKRPAVDGFERMNLGVLNMPVIFLRLLSLYKAMTGQTQNGLIADILTDWLTQNKKSLMLKLQFEADAYGLDVEECERRLLEGEDLGQLASLQRRDKAYLAPDSSFKS